MTEGKQLAPGHTAATSAEREEFRRGLEDYLSKGPKTPLQEKLENLADRRLRLEFGEIKESKDARSEHWMSREVNRFITERYRQQQFQEQLRGVWLGVWTAIVLGVLALVVTTLALPTKESLFALTLWPILKTNRDYLPSIIALICALAILVYGFLRRPRHR